MTTPTDHNYPSGQPYSPPMQNADGSWAQLPPPIWAGGDGGGSGGNKRRNWFARHKVLTGLGAVVGLFIVGALATPGGDGGGKPLAPAASSEAVVAPRPPAPLPPEPAATASPSAKAPAPAPKPVPAAVTIPGDGTFLVGADIKAGTYRTTGPNAERKDFNMPCYWYRASSASGDSSDIVANGLPVGPTVVTIRASDKVFSSDGCATWTLVR